MTIKHSDVATSATTLKCYPSSQELKPHNPICRLKNYEYQFYKYHGLFSVSTSFQGGRLLKHLIYSDCPDPFYGSHGIAPSGHISAWCTAKTAGGPVSYIISVIMILCQWLIHLKVQNPLDDPYTLNLFSSKCHVNIQSSNPTYSCKHKLNQVPNYKLTHHNYNHRLAVTIKWLQMSKQKCIDHMLEDEKTIILRIKVNKLLVLITDIGKSASMVDKV
ncbi:hypothetical protein BD769DRAFT_1400454 [Suillus cothurnatus]|nr:hypothetical protein BD769DRAFT_1400454 [Suillus cothurnatus]